MASAFFSPSFSANKKKEKKAAKTESLTMSDTVSLCSSSDTLSYTAGVMISKGIMPQIQRMGVDSAYIDVFLQAMDDFADKGDDPAFFAYYMGCDVFYSMNKRMIDKWVKGLEDAPDSVVTPLVYRGFIDGLMNDSTLYSVSQATEEFNTRYEANREAREEKLYGPNRRAGEAFLEANKSDSSVVVMPSGLQYKVLVEGSGEKPESTDKVLVNYEGRLIDGTVFDSSARHGDEPKTLKIQQLIKGWNEALCLMSVGSKWRLFIPYQIGYGNRETGMIKPYSAIIFDVELVGIVE